MSEQTTSSRGHGLLAAHLRVFLCLILLLALVRVALVAWLGERAWGTSSVGHILLGGLRMDVVALSYALAPAVLLSLVFGGRHVLGRLLSGALRLYLTGLVTLIAFMELATPPFILEYDSRPNRLFVEYLVHPREVGTMLWRGYKLELFLAGAGTAAILVLAWKLLGRWTRPTRAVGVLERLALFLVLVPLLLLGARSSLQHRPANPSSVAFCSDHLLNDLALSSAYSVAYAIDQLQDEADAGAVYGWLESERAILDEVRAAMVTVPPEAYVSDELPTLHMHEASTPRERPLNLVILLEESLGAQYVGALGGEPVTQFLDTLRDEGWWFERMYATGTRSVRGLEAVTAGFPPSPARSVVKLGMSQQGFFTIADFLGRQGYRTQFIYGGESHFDNMKRFFTGNGIQDIVDHDDFVDPTFDGSWGVCDEEVLMRAHEEFLAFGDEPFFSLVFSVTNHSPWEYPAGKVEPEGDEPATNRNAVRYADHALGRFFEVARRAPYWENTVFLVVADHDSRVYGASLVPIEHYHIPAVILAPGLEPRRDTRIASQMDLPVTVLSLMGVSGLHPMIGHDLTRLPDDAQGRAMMQYGRNQAYMQGDSVVVLQPDLEPTQWTWDGAELVPATLDPALSRRALAHALLPSWLYRERRYRVPAETCGMQSLMRSQ